MKSLQIILLSFFLFSFFSCREESKKNKNDLTHYAFEDAPSEDVDAINQEIISPDTVRTGIITTAAKGSLWTAFTKTFKDCWQDETFKKNIIYLGPSNSKYLGTIVSKDKQITWKSLEKVLNGNYNEINKFCQQGNGAPNNCNKDELINNYFDILLDGNYSNIDANLKLALEDRRQIKMITGKWRVDEIILGDFNSYMDKSTDPAVIDYKRYLTNKNNYIITKILVIENFSAEVESNRKMDAGLTAKLDTGINTEIKNQGNDSSDTQLNINFKHTADNKIAVSATGKSYVIGMLQKVKNIK
ncbi:hypothetical protein [Chryseobacterium sp. MMS23-Vi53]|uniref:hypothetical protein n=1 Tax=Chryseobacterium sp. MMS23-Vi53 TaxID=3386644 RepID=UPI0039ECB90B